MVSLVLAAALAAAPPPTVRVDYVHGGDATHEWFRLERVVLEPLPFPGRPDRPLDGTGLGGYLLEVRAQGSGELLYSRGFSSLFGEWATTAEARSVARAFSESVRIPAPTGRVDVVVRRRGAGGRFEDVWSVPVTPGDGQAIGHAVAPGDVIELQRNGPPESRLDLLLLGDGYTREERAAFELHARILLEELFAVEPFRSRRADFNVWGLCPPAAERGISRPSAGIQRRSPAGASYGVFGPDHHVLSLENRALRDLAAVAPYDALVVLVNDDAYGGGGIFNLYATVAARSPWAGYIFVHELGHALAGLGDEYFTGSGHVAAQVDAEPWYPNVTSDPRATKWRDLHSAGVPLPTPWPKEEFLALEAALQREGHAGPAALPGARAARLRGGNVGKIADLLAAAPFARAVGAFEGAAYTATGLYRPQIDCVMFSRSDVPFCAGCRRAIDRVIELYAAPRPTPAGATSPPRPPR